MKIAWFTPFSTNSAIGRCGNLIAGELQKHADLHIWHPETDRAIQAPVRTVSFRSAAGIDLNVLRDYDLVVYNFGNHLPFHKEIFLTAQRFPGLCVLHDFVMHHFFAAYYLEDLKTPEAYKSIMQRRYGQAGLVAAEDSLAGKVRIWDTDEIARFPLFEEALQYAIGVVTHSEFLRQKVQQAYAGPLARLALPYDVMPACPSLTREALQIPESHILLVTVGHINRNKRVHSVIKALADNPAISSHATYAVLGQCESEYFKILVAMVEEFGLQSSVRFLGYAPDDIFHAYAGHADIFLNLRFPAMEGASASVIEEMLCGKPVIVTDTGFYQELPSECVWKIDPEREESDLKTALQLLSSDPNLRAQFGTRARAYAADHFRADRYVAELLRFANEVRGVAPILRLTDTLADELNVMGVTSSMNIVQTLSSQVHELLCSSRLEDSGVEASRKLNSESAAGESRNRN